MKRIAFLLLLLAACTSTPEPEDPSDDVPMEDDGTSDPEGDTLDCELPEQRLTADASASERAAARKLASDGMRAMSRGDAKTAVHMFCRAHQQVPTPTLLVQMARAQIKLDRKDAARASLQAAVDFPVMPHEPRVFAHARRDARALLKTLPP